MSDVTPAARLPALTPELRRDIEERITEFEQEHQSEVARGRAGWVARITTTDYVVAAVVNLALLIWLIVTWVG